MLFRGQFIGLCIRAKSIEVSSDQFGLCPIFYYDGQFGPIVSNSYSTLVDTMKALDVPVTLNPVNSTAIFSIKGTPGVQLSNRCLPVEGTKICLSTEKIEITNGKMNLRRGPEVALSSAICKDEYVHLISCGAREIKNNISTAINSLQDPIYVDIGGGRDSRIVFAGLVSLGLIRKVRFNTSDANQTDLEIGSSLVSHFGGAYRKFMFSRFESSSLENQISRHQNVFCGLYSDFTPRANIRAIPEQRNIRMSGGCGEIYRSFYTNIMSARERRISSRRDLRTYFARNILHAAVSNQIYEQLVEAYVAQFEYFGAETLANYYDRHYEEFRNRMHFGLASIPHDEFSDITWMPLISPSLLRAARGLPDEVRVTGRVCFDVTKALCEELAYVKYDRAQPNYETIPYHRSSRFDGKTIELKSGIGAWKERSFPHEMREAFIDQNKIDPITVRSQIDYLRVRHKENLEVIAGALGSYINIDFLNRRFNAVIEKENLAQAYFWFLRIDGLAGTARMAH